MRRQTAMKQCLPCRSKLSASFKFAGMAARAPEKGFSLRITTFKWMENPNSQPDAEDETRLKPLKSEGGGAPNATVAHTPPPPPPDQERE